MAGQITISDGHGVGDGQAPEGHDAAMAAKADAAANPAGGDPAGEPGGGEPTTIEPLPPGGVDKFYEAKTGVYNWEGHAKEAEFNANRGKPADPKAAATAKPGDPVPGLDLKPFHDEYQQLGSLTEESYGLLEKQGLSRAVVDDYISGLKATSDIHEAGMYDSVGGEENYKKMVAWSETNLTDEEKGVFNAEIFTPGAGADAALAGLYARFQNDVGTDSNYIEGGGGGDAGGDAYESNEQLMVDMRNPKYQQDEAFRAEVRAKLARSNILNDAIKRR